MAASDARPVPIKNTAFRVTFPIWDADGDLVTGATGLDSEVSKDGGTFTDCTNEATELATSSGMYYLDLTSTEMNADTVAVIVKTSSSGAKTTVLVFYPNETGDIDVDTTAVGGTAQTAGDLAALITTLDDYVDTEVAAIKAKTDNLPADPADASDIAASFTTVNTKLDTIDDFLDTEIAAIKAKTDNLPTDPADASDIAASFTSLNTKVDTIDDFLDTEVAAILAAVDTEVGAIKTKTDQLTFTTANQVDAGVLSMAAGSVTAASIATGAVDADALATDAVTEIVSAIFARTFEATKMSGYTFEELTALIACGMMAKLSGAATTSIAIRNLGDTADAITATVDADGNRSVVTRTLASVR